MRPTTIKGFVYNIVGETGDKQFPTGGTFVILGANSDKTLALTTEENIVLFSTEILKNTEAFKLSGVFASDEIEAVFRPIINRMKKGLYETFDAASGTTELETNKLEGKRV